MFGESIFGQFYEAESHVIEVKWMGSGFQLGKRVLLDVLKRAVVT